MATRIQPRSTEQTEAMHFPLAGIDLTVALEKQPARPIGGGRYARTTPSATNVRGYEATTNRARGGSRPGLSKYIAAPVVSGWIIQHLDVLVSAGVAVQQSQSGRVVTLVAVSQGDVYTLNPGDTAWATATNSTGNTPALNFTGVMQSASNGQRLFFADGVNYAYYDPSDGTVKTWAHGTTDLDGNAISGTLPVDSSANTPRLICNWRGSIVLSGLFDDQQNWFISATNDPFNFDYGVISQTATQAIAGNNAPMGLVGDKVTGLIPYSDDVLIFLCDHSVYMMRGDPRAGGSLDLVSDVIGGAWGQAWCKDPYGTVYFVSNRMGIYTLVPGQQPQRISQPIEQLIQPVDTGASGIRLTWDDRYQGLHVFISPIDSPGAATHYFYEQRSGAWWQDTFTNHDHDPLCCVTFDGNDATDRVPLIGSWDGYVRTISATSTTDDGVAIASSVVIGPILTATTDDMLLKEIQAVLGESSGEVAFAVYVGQTAEQALASDPVEEGTWEAGRNPTNLIRRAGHAIYVKLTAVNPWTMETIRAVIDTRGKVRQRRQY